jgi:hypothetical protein
MGLSSGHTFTDGETVTAAKLNNLVNNGTITTNTITTGMLLDDSVTSAKLAPNAVTGASISANTINLSTLSNASGGTSGTLVQSGSGGVFEELSPGATGTVLVSGGTDAALSFGTIDNVAIGATMISGHTALTDPGQDDLLLVKDKNAGVNKSVQIQNLYKTVNDLNALSSSDIANPDEFLVIDGGSTPKKITYQNLQSSLGGLASTGSNYYTSTGDTLYDILDDSSNLATFAHGLSSTPRLIRVVIVCETDDTSGFGFSVGDEIDMANAYYWDGDNYQVAAATVIADSTSIKAQFQTSITNTGLALAMMQKTSVSGRAAGGIYYFSDVTGSTARYKIKVYAWS